MGQRTQDQFAIPRPKVGDSGFLFGGGMPRALFYLLCFCQRPLRASEIASCDSMSSWPFLGEVYGGGGAGNGRVGGRAACGALGGLSGLPGPVPGGAAGASSDPRASITAAAAAVTLCAPRAPHTSAARRHRRSGAPLSSEPQRSG